MPIQFTKMHGLGNDFMVIDGIHQKVQLTAERIVQWSNRFTGIGFDQCLLIEPAQTTAVDFNYRIFNANGQEVGQCGNGARCLALFIKHRQLSAKNTFRVATSTTQMQLTIHANQSVSIEMDVPQTHPQRIPFLTETVQNRYCIDLDQQRDIPIHVINVGNPHAVLIVDHFDDSLIQDWGKQISTHRQFPEQTNVGFMRILSPERIELRVYERGCGETKACGSGAVAAAAIGQLYYHLKDSVQVQLQGGTLLVDWPDKQQSIRMTGPAVVVYDGLIAE
ncbi:MAG: diaminopimelate epimerase [Legionella sp.]|nr:MAG: diaminopimelate epimerase [Legionella sp.]PJE00048.1 MAG: diaminopimelate epimerase [Legionella sp.]